MTPARTAKQRLRSGVEGARMCIAIGGAIPPFLAAFALAGVAQGWVAFWETPIEDILLGRRK